MKSIRNIIVLATVAAAGFAQAQEATPFPARDSLASTATRAEVCTEAQSAIAAGQHEWGNMGPSAKSMFSSKRDRAEVRAEGAKLSRLSPSAALAHRLQNGV